MQRSCASGEWEVVVKNIWTQNALAREISRFSAWLCLAFALAVLAGCGSGQAIPSQSTPGATTGGATSGTGSIGGTGTGGISQTITGTIATGAPVAGAAITVQDHNGKTNTGTSGADGSFAVSVTGGTPPFILAAVLPSCDPTKTPCNMYSILPSMDMSTTGTLNVNITPITTVVMYELNGNADPASMYTGFTSTNTTDLSAGAVAAKETSVRNKLPANKMNPIFSMMYGKFTASAGDPYDDLLAIVGKITAINSQGVQLTPTGGTAVTYGSPAGSGAVPGAANAAAIALNLTDLNTGQPVSQISNSSPAKVTATVTNANGTQATGVVVTFSTNASTDTFAGGANTALTNASGVASVTLTTSNTSGGAATLTANSTVAGAGVTGTINYAIGASTIGLSPIFGQTFGNLDFVYGTGAPTPVVNAAIQTLSAYGTASVSVYVQNTTGTPAVTSKFNTPMTVSFTSACAAAGKATLTPSVSSVNGKATASYLDNGCNNPTSGDTITATLSNGTTQTAQLLVGQPSLGSIQYVSTVTAPATTPPVITLKGTGGANRSETAKVTFKVVDSAGNPVGNTTVNFSLNTSVGGLSLSSTTATSDPSTGYVVTNVIAGTVATAVRVTATTGVLSTQSDQLVVSTGIPAQDSFSLSASQHNIEGWNIDGTTTTLSLRAADHFHNPVPDGTAISFTSEGGSVVASCNTVNGACTSILTSQALRPSNGRVTVLAHATGEEAFVDQNFDGLMNSAAEMVDANNVSTDMPEAFVDYNENGIRDAVATTNADGTSNPAEPFFDFNGDKQYNGSGGAAIHLVGVTPVGNPDIGDGKYEGVLCSDSAKLTGGICDTPKLPDGTAQRSIDVRASQIIVFSSSAATIAINNNANIALPHCNPLSGVTPIGITVTVVDANGNAMPAGTTIAFSSDNALFTPTTVTVPDTIGCRLNNPVNGAAYACPAHAASATFGDIALSIKSNATWDSSGLKCTDTSSSGTFTVTVTTPGVNFTSGNIKATETIKNIIVTD